VGSGCSRVGANFCGAIVTKRTCTMFRSCIVGGGNINWLSSARIPPFTRTETAREISQSRFSQTTKTLSFQQPRPAFLDSGRMNGARKRCVVSRPE